MSINESLLDQEAAKTMPNEYDRPFWRLDLISRRWGGCALLAYFLSLSANDLEQFFGFEQKVGLIPSPD